VFKPEQERQIFGNIAQVYGVNAQLLEKLYAAVASWDEVCDVLFACCSVAQCVVRDAGHVACGRCAAQIDQHLQTVRIVFGRVQFGPQGKSITLHQSSPVKSRCDLMSLTSTIFAKLLEELEAKKPVAAYCQQCQVMGVFCLIERV
jgi:hypothetical protein